MESTCKRWNYIYFWKGNANDELKLIGRKIFQVSGDNLIGCVGRYNQSFGNFVLDGNLVAVFYDSNYQYSQFPGITSFVERILYYIITNCICTRYQIRLPLESMMSG